METCVLVIADDLEERASIARALQIAGHKVELEERSKRAIKLAQGRKFEAAIVALSAGPAGEALVRELSGFVPKVITLVDAAKQLIRPDPDLFPADAILTRPLDQRQLLTRIAELKRSSLNHAIEAFAFEGCTFDVSGRTFLDSAGREAPLTRSEAGLLTTLLSSPGRVLSRDELRRALAGRGVEAYDRSIDILVGRLRRKIEPDPKTPRFIVTVSGAGYKFVASPVSAELKSSSAASGPDGTGPPRLSIVVLPFANLSGDSGQDYFADGVTESLTTDLSRISGALVIGRHTAFTYKGKSADLRQIGRELSVRYVLEGSVQRSGDRMRVSAQLISTATGSHLWAERFDQTVADLFDTQDEIVARLARQLDATLVASEARRAERTQRPDSTDMLFQGMSWFNKGPAPGNLEQAAGFFARALAIDGRNVDALAWKALTYAFAHTMGFALDNERPALATAEDTATKALSLNPECAMAHFALGVVLGFSKRLERAIAESERAISLDRNFALAHAVIGLHKLHLDRAEETEAHVKEALRLSPRDVFVFVWLAIIGFANDFLQRYEEAVLWQRRSIETNPGYAIAHFHLASALAHLDRMEEARAAAQAGLAVDPRFTVGWFPTVTYSDSQTHLAWRGRLADGMRRAGLPEG